MMAIRFIKFSTQHSAVSIQLMPVVAFATGQPTAAIPT
jgi:hypothetical protein